MPSLRHKDGTSKQVMALLYQFIEAIRRQPSDQRSEPGLASLNPLFLRKKITKGEVRLIDVAYRAEILTLFILLYRKGKNKMQGAEIVDNIIRHSRRHES